MNASSTTERKVECTEKRCLRLGAMAQSYKMINPMKHTSKTLLLALALGGVGSITPYAQDAGSPPPPNSPPPHHQRGPQGGENGARPRHPASPLVAALDANGDGIIDATELANATEALKKLDKNGDGKLTPDEYRPARPMPPGGPNGQGQPPGPQGAAPRMHRLPPPQGGQLDAGQPPRPPVGESFAGQPLPPPPGAERDGGPRPPRTDADRASAPQPPPGPVGAE